MYLEANTGFPSRQVRVYCIKEGLKRKDIALNIYLPLEYFD